MKTNALTGLALDWAVATANGDTFTLAHEDWDWYSSSWEYGGPIIERESIRLMPEQGATYVDCVWLAGNANEDGDEFNGEGPTPLIAAMRCFVASKMGDEIEIPKELT